MPAGPDNPDSMEGELPFRKAQNFPPATSRHIEKTWLFAWPGLAAWQFCGDAEVSAYPRRRDSETGG
jgi:hypothetical protein